MKTPFVTISLAVSVKNLPIKVILYLLLSLFYSIVFYNLTDKFILYQIFPGNSNPEENVKIDFPTELEARYVKLFPQEWIGHICLQVQFYGHKGRLN